MNARNNLFNAVALDGPVHDFRFSSLRSWSSALIGRVIGVIKANPLAVFIGLCDVIFYAGVILFLLTL
jgi:hypothetical protein